MWLFYSKEEKIQIVCTKMHKQLSTMIYVNSIIREIKVYVGKTHIANSNMWLCKTSQTGFGQFTKHWTCSLYGLPSTPDLHDGILMGEKKGWCVIASHNWQDLSCDFGLNKLKLKRGNICKHGTVVDNNINKDSENMSN